MSRSSARRGLVEPLPALAAVLVVGLALGLYADALATVESVRSESGTARATLQSAHVAVTGDSTALPGRVPGAADVGPAGYHVNVTLTTGDQQWSAGPVPPTSATDARRRTPVRLDRWTVRPGWLTVEVWT